MSSQARFSGPRLDPGSYATQREGIPLANISKLGECPHCGQEVLRTAMVKSAAPIALEPSDAGVIAVWEDGRAQVLYGEDLRWAKVEGRELYLDHFADCVGRHEEAEVTCYFAASGIAEECSFRADGRPDPCHLIDQQRIKQTYEARGEECPDLSDPALIVPGCRFHHKQHDGYFRRLEADQYPTKTLQWAEAHDFFWDERRQAFIGRVPLRRAA
jgi:hypothetical protein